MTNPVTTVVVGLWAWFAATALPWLRDLLFDFGKFWLGPIVSVILSPGVKLWAMMIALWEASAWVFPVIKHAFETVVGLDALFSPGGLFAPDSTLLHYGAFINRFVPLTESFALIVVLFNLWLAVTVMRFGKWLILIFIGL